MRKLMIVLLVLALVGCQSFKALPPDGKALVIGAAVIFAGVVGGMIYIAATTPPMTREQYDSIFGGAR